MFKNKKGFTLIEIIGTVIILGILAIITVPMFTKNLAGFRDDYYSNIESTLKNSGKEFFNDNRKYRPNKYLESSKVSLATLEGKKYLDDEVLDYEGNSCDKESYVIVIKKGKDDYDYHVCLACPNDDFENTNGNKYCSSAWDIPTLDYTLGDIDTIYVYKDADRNTLIEKTAIPLSVVKKDEDGNVLEEVSGDGEDGIEYINPVNIDTINTNVIGEYPLEYEYVGPDDGDPNTEDKVTKEGKVIVYENSAPVISVTKTNNVASSRTANNNQVTDYGMGGTWAQQLTVNFVRGDGKYTETNTNVSKYQWKRGNKWIDFCNEVNSSGGCTITIGRKSNDTLGNEHDMNEDVQFRIIDTEGNISLVSPSYRFMIDNTNPSCNISLSGTMGNNNWYTTDVTVTEVNMMDVEGISPAAKSGVKYYTINNSEIASRTVVATTGGISHGTISGVQNVDTSSVTWYGFIEDNAQNYSICSNTFKRDATKPFSDWNPASDGPHNNNDGITVNGTCNDAMSGAISHSKSEYISSPANGKVVSISCTDNAGNTATLTKTYYVAKWCQSTACGWNSCLTGENTCSYGCDTCSRQSCSGKTWQSTCDGYKVGGDCYDTCTTESYSCNCSDCYTGHNTCQGGYNTCWATYCDV